MLSEFITEHRTTIIERCRARVLGRMAPRPTRDELEKGIPIFLDQLAAVLATKLSNASHVVAAATKHGADLMRSGFTVAQVVHDYGDVCQSVTELAFEKDAEISAHEFQTLNLCLDEAIAGAVTEFARLRELAVSELTAADGDARATLDIGVLAHELRNLLSTATLATEILRGGNVSIGGSTGSALVRSLGSMRELIDRSFVVVRLRSGLSSPTRIVIAGLVEELEVAAMLQANVFGHRLTVDTQSPDAVVFADRQILASIVMNFLHNAFKYTRAQTHVTLRSLASAGRVVLEVQDQCGGLPSGAADTLFEPYAQLGADRSGLGLGLDICQRGAAAIGAGIRVRDLPGEGCVFSVDLPAGEPS